MERRLDEEGKRSRGKAVNDKRRKALEPVRAAKAISWNWQRGEVVFHETGIKVPLAKALKGQFPQISKSSFA